MCTVKSSPEIRRCVCCFERLVKVVDYEGLSSSSLCVSVVCVDWHIPMGSRGLGRSLSYTRPAAMLCSHSVDGEFEWGK